MRALHERTDGVPLFVASVTNDVIARAEQARHPHWGNGIARQHAGSGGPDGDHRSLHAQTRRPTAHTARSGSGLRRRLSQETLARVLERDATDISEACEQLVREQRWLILPRDSDYSDLQKKSYSFQHALLREVIYERTAPSTRAELHRKVGAALESERAAGLAVTAAELAMHFDRGGAPVAALRYYAEGAETALLNLSPAECMSLTERALTLLEHTPACTERTSLEITLATLRGVSAFHVLGAGDDENRLATRLRPASRRSGAFHAGTSIAWTRISAHASRGVR